MNKKIENIIIQAGGKGSRLETLTLNKPKCLVPVNNLPIIFYIFKKFPNANFKIIADYKFDVLERYLKIFATEFNFEIIKTNKKGTCSGISPAISKLKSEDPFMLIWCDLILSDNFELPNTDNNFVGISKDFECRWSYKKDNFIEEASKEDGVAGLFIFENTNLLKDVPQEGEFVSWLSRQNIKFDRLNLNGSKEVGTMISYYENNQSENRCRPFNKIDFYEDYVEKYPIDEQGEKLAINELDWYKTINNFSHFKYIPKIHSFEPFRIERIKGKNIFEYQSLTLEQKKGILEKIINVLKELHSLDKKIPSSTQDCQLNYIDKTFERLDKVRELIPFAKDEFIKINGEYLKNPLFIKDELIKKLKNIFPNKFSIIHGDPTFSNLMLRANEIEPVLIDPRGYFGNSKIYGDVNYDWAKLYYSLVGNYDQFNNKNFALQIKEDDIYFKVNSNNWEDVEDYFFEKTGCNKLSIKLLHAVIWLSLTTYSWEDYDSICGAFYNGVIYLNEIL